MCVAQQDVLAAGKQLSQFVVDVEDGLRRKIRSCAKVNAVEVTVCIFSKSENMSKVRRGETLCGDLFGGNEAAIPVKVATQSSIHEVRHEGPSGRSPARHKVKRIGDVFQSPYRIECIIIRIEITPVPNHLNQSQRNHNRAVFLFIRDHLAADVFVFAGSPHADPSSITGVTLPPQTKTHGLNDQES